MNHYPRHIGDYLRDTGHLSLLEHGVYSRLLDIYYLNDGPLQLTVDDLIRKLCARAQDEREAVERVLREFFAHCNGIWSHKRADKEIERYKAKASLASSAGKASAASRLNKSAATDVQHSLNGRSTDVQRTLSETATGVEKTSTDVQPTNNQNQNQNQNHSTPPSPPVGGKGRKEKVVNWFEFLPAELNSDQFKAAWLEFVVFRKAIKKPVNLASAPAFFRKAVRVGVEAAIAGMETSIANGWQGVFQPEKTKHDHRSEKRSREFSEQLVVPDFE